MTSKPLPPKLTTPLYTPEALKDLADKIGQLEDGKAFDRLSRERGKNQKPASD